MKRQGTTLHQHAKAYVDSALDAQRRSGHEPQVSEEAYTAAVARAEKGFAGLTAGQSRTDEGPAPA